jgi:hypothetical protein
MKLTWLVNTKIPQGGGPHGFVSYILCLGLRVSSQIFSIFLQTFLVLCRILDSHSQMFLPVDESQNTQGVTGVRIWGQTREIWTLGFG